MNHVDAGSSLQNVCPYVTPFLGGMNEHASIVEHIMIVLEGFYVFRLHHHERLSCITLLLGGNLLVQIWSI